MTGTTGTTSMTRQHKTDSFFLSSKPNSQSLTLLIHPCSMTSECTASMSSPNCWFSVHPSTQSKTYT